MFAGCAYQPGQRVVDAGTPAEFCYVIASGTYRVTAPEVNRGRSILGTYQAGSVLAERVLYRAIAQTKLGKLPFTITCTSAGEVFRLPVASFMQIAQHVSSGDAFSSDNA